MPRPLRDGVLLGKENAGRLAGLARLAICSRAGRKLQFPVTADANRWVLAGIGQNACPSDIRFRRGTRKAVGSSDPGA